MYLNQGQKGQIIQRFLGHPDIPLPPTHEGKLCVLARPASAHQATDHLHAPTANLGAEWRSPQEAVMIPQHHHATNPNKIITDVVTHLKMSSFSRYPISVAL